MYKSVGRLHWVTLHGYVLQNNILVKLSIYITAHNIIALWTNIKPALGLSLVFPRIVSLTRLLAWLGGKNSVM